MAHPWNRELVLEVAHSGTVIERRVSDGTIVKMHRGMKHVGALFDNMFPICGAHGEYFLLGIRARSRYIVAFSSASGKWTDVPWRLGNVTAISSFGDPLTSRVGIVVRPNQTADQKMPSDNTHKRNGNRVLID